MPEHPAQPTDRPAPAERGVPAEPAVPVTPPAAPAEPTARLMTDDEAAFGPGGAPEAAPLPEGRYGSTGRARFSRRAQVWTASAALVVVVAIIGWATMGPDTTTVRGKDVGFSVQGPEAVDITFDVAKPRDATVVCSLDALSANYAQVGTKDVTIGPSDMDEGRYTTTIATTELAVTAVVVACELVD